MPKKILVLKNEGSMGIDSHEWLDMEILNYNQMIIDGEPTCLLKEPSGDLFYSVSEKIHNTDGLMIFAHTNKIQCIINLEKTLINQNVPYVILHEEVMPGEYNTDNYFLINSDNRLKSIINALNKISKLINIQNEEQKEKTILEKSQFNELQTPHFEKKKFDLKNYNNEMEMHHTESLKNIQFSLHPIMLDPVKSSLEKLGFSNITLTNIKQLNSCKSSHETYRASNYEINYKPRHELKIIVRESEVPFIINLLKNISNEDIDDTVIITPVINALRIRTEEEGPDAID